MTRKMIKDLELGDVVALEGGKTGARVRSIQQSRLFQSPGGCWRLDLTVINGPYKGEKINDQHHPGTSEVELFNETAGGVT